MNILLESCRDDVLDDTLFNFVVPMIVNFPQLLINILLLLLLNLLNHIILFLNELGNLWLLVISIGLGLNLGLELLNGRL